MHQQQAAPSLAAQLAAPAPHRRSPDGTAGTGSLVAATVLAGTAAEAEVLCKAAFLGAAAHAEPLLGAAGAVGLTVGHTGRVDYLGDAARFAA